MSLWLPLGLAWFAGCAEFEQVHQVELPADGVWSMFADDDRGDIAYTGTAPDETFTITVTSWGRARSKARAERRAGNNTFGAAVSGELLDLWGRSPLSRSGVDLDVVGPSVLDVEAYTADGTVALYGVDGFHYVTGSRVVGEKVYGDIDAYAEPGGIDVEVFPYTGSVVRLEAVGGDLFVSLPWGLPYDLQLAGDPAYGYELDDLGFDELALGPGYAFASTADGSVRVELYATGGTIYVYQAY